MSTTTPYRVLVVDDTPAIHDDYRKVLCPPSALPDGLTDMEALLFGDAPGSSASLSSTRSPQADVTFTLDSAYQGQEGIDKLVAALKAGAPLRDGVR